MSIEQFLDWPEAPGKRLELAHGRLIEMPASGGGHGYLATKLAVALERQCGHLGYVLTGDTLFILSQPEAEKPLTMASDVSFTRTERAPDRRNFKAFYAPWRVAPDLVIEIASPSDRPGDVAKKTRAWLAGGVTLVWVVWPALRRVDVWRPGDTSPSEELGLADTLGAGGIAPFVLPVRDLF
jgi:Uma2 family endonuclease